MFNNVRLYCSYCDSRGREVHHGATCPKLVPSGIIVDTAMLAVKIEPFIFIRNTEPMDTNWGRPSRSATSTARELYPLHNIWPEGMVQWTRCPLQLSIEVKSDREGTALEHTTSGAIDDISHSGLVQTRAGGTHPIHLVLAVCPTLVIHFTRTVPFFQILTLASLLHCRNRMCGAKGSRVSFEACDWVCCARPDPRNDTGAVATANNQPSIRVLEKVKFVQVRETGEGADKELHFRSHGRRIEPEPTECDAVPFSRSSLVVLTTLRSSSRTQLPCRQCRWRLVFRMSETSPLRPLCDLNRAPYWVPFSVVSRKMKSPDMSEPMVRPWTVTPRTPCITAIAPRCAQGARRKDV
jgi:hypothetical protein